MRKYLAILFFVLPVLGFSEELISINAVGDTMIGSLYPHEVIPPQKGMSAFKFVKEYLKVEMPDIIMANLEAPITYHNVTYKKVGNGKTFAFNMPPYLVSVIKDAGFNLVTTANNHAMDFGDKGYKDTRKYLSEQGIAAIGNKNEIATMKIKNKLVAFIGFSWHSFSNNYLNSAESMKLIKKAKASHDIVVISVHGGSEGEQALHIKNQEEYMYSEYRGNLLKFCRMAVDNGADLIIGHGPHVPRGMEVYKNRLIAYSLGNFATYQLFMANGNKKLSLVLNVKLDDKGQFAGGKIVPLVQFEEGQYKGLPQYDPQKRTIKLIKKLSKEDFPGNPILISDEGEISLKK